MTAVATPLDAARAYFDAWNRRDPEAIVGTFEPSGTYEDPTTGGALTGPAIASYAQALFDAFPDLSFEASIVVASGADLVVANWTMRGTNSGSLRGAPPTGGQIALPGVDVIRVGTGGVSSVVGYFDRMTLPEQLGMRVLIAPPPIGSVSFGTSLRASTGKTAIPGAFSLTMMEVRSTEEEEQVRADTRKLIPELLRMRGFISLVAVTVGSRMMTISAWERPEDTAQLRSSSHAGSVRTVMSGAIGRAGHFGVWVPHHVAAARVRCDSCGAWARAEGGDATCACGAALPAPPAAW